MSNAYLTHEQREDRLAESHRQSSTFSLYDPPHLSNPRESSYSYVANSPINNTSAPLRPLSHEGYRDYDEPFDVRADFDGDGPRWSELYGQKSGALLKDAERGVGEEEYKRLDSHVAPSGQQMAYGAVDPMAYTGQPKGYNKIEQGREELVSVPVLGPEWKRAELHELSRRGQSEVKQEKRSEAWKLWKRDQRGLCGVRWLTRRALVFFLFFLIIALAITLYFVIPRVPNFSFYTDQPFSVDNSTVQFSRSPTNFSFAGNLNLYADTSSSYLPVHFSSLEATLYNLDTTKVIATGNYGNHKVPRGNQQPIILPVSFSYSALNATDMTWNDIYDACGHIWTGTTRPDLKLRLELRMSIVGLVGHPFSQTSISDVTCPFQLPANGP